MVICHGDFLNSDYNYIHHNKSIKGFGSYGDIMIRDRKMYVAPTPFALAAGTTGTQTLILPADFRADNRFNNPTANKQHKFIAYRLKSQGGKSVSMMTDFTEDSTERNK
jgi:hypothetical protein